LEKLVKSEATLPVVIRATSEVKNDSEDDKANDCQDLDGSGDAMRPSVRDALSIDEIDSEK
jgi:hypothetical protein